MEYEVRLRCEMCLRKFISKRDHMGRLPHNCPGCTKRRAAERSRQRMAKMRASRRCREEIA